MPEISAGQACLQVADLPQRRPHRFDLTPTPEETARIAQALQLDALRKLSFSGTLRPEGRQGWRLEAALGATVVQPCIVTLDPVTTRIDRPVTRLYVKNWEETVTSDDMEMPEDDTIEPLESSIDLLQVLTEALALALPDYPRADGAELETARFAPPGTTPLTDEDTKPFAALKDLKKKLEKPG